MTAYSRFVADFHLHFTRDPNRCVSLGVEKHLDQLPDPTLEALTEDVISARHLLGRIDSLTTAQRSFDEFVDLELAELQLERQIHDASVTLDGRTHRESLPSAGDDVGEGIFMLFVNDPRPVGDRLEDISGRIEKVPGYLEALLARLDTPVARWVEIDGEKVAGLPGLFDSILRWAKTETWADQYRLEQACVTAKAALAGYARSLSRLPTRREFQIGSRAAQRIVDLRGISMSLSELHEAARAFLRENAETLEVLRGRLTGKHGLPRDTSTDRLHQELNRRYRIALPGDDLNTVLTHYEKERDRIQLWVERQSLFPIPDEQEIKILRTPRFLEPSIPAGAMSSPPPFRTGVARSLVYLTLSDELLDEHNELAIPNMMIHEGIPGHHLQLTWAARNPSVIRRHADAMDQAEGWTTMLEDFILDQGYMGDLTDEARFIGKRDIARLGARVAIDLFFMTGDADYLDVGVDFDNSPQNPFEAAGNLLQAVTGFTPERSQAELNWYSQERGYPLSYLAGNRLVWDLKREVTASHAAQGGRDDLEVDRRFHETYLRAGAMPVSMLRRVFEHEGLIGG